MALEPDKEFEGLNRTHDLDNAKFIAWVKKTIKSKTIRINKYMISTISDGKMLKIEVEKFIKGKTQGVRTVKGYLSEAKCTDLVTLLDAIPKTTYQDMRTKNDMQRPQKVLQQRRSADKDIDLDNLF